MFEETLDPAGTLVLLPGASARTSDEPGFGVLCVPGVSVEDLAQAAAEDWAAHHGLVDPGTATQAVTDAVAELTGPDLARYLSCLPDPAGVDGWTVIEAIRGWEKIKRHAEAQQAAWIAELGARRPATGSKWARHQPAETEPTPTGAVELTRLRGHLVSAA